MMKALANDKIVQNVNHTLVVSFLPLSLKISLSFFSQDEQKDWQRGRSRVDNNWNKYENNKNLSRTPNLSR